MATKQAGWRGDDRERRFRGRKALGWLGRQIMKTVFCPSPADGWLRVKFVRQSVSPAFAERIVAWYLERADQYVAWVDDDRFHGSRFAHGAWWLLPKRIAADYVLANAFVSQAYDHEEFPTLDDWLRADIANDLTYDGAAGGMPFVRGAGVVRRFPKRCRQPAREYQRACRCGAEFVTNRKNGANCPKCIAMIRTHGYRHPKGATND